MEQFKKDYYKETIKNALIEVGYDASLDNNMLTMCLNGSVVRVLLSVVDEAEEMTKVTLREDEGELRVSMEDIRTNWEEELEKQARAARELLK